MNRSRSFCRSPESKRRDSVVHSEEMTDSSSPSGRITPIVEKKFAKAGAFDTLEKLLRNDLIGIDACSIERRDQSGMNVKRIHVLCGVRCQVPGRHDLESRCYRAPDNPEPDNSRSYLNSHFLTSVKCPVIAAAAAIIGLTR